MSYWIFRNEESGQCTAVSDECLESLPIEEELGELLHDGPMPDIIAKLYLAKFGGEVLQRPPS